MKGKKILAALGFFSIAGVAGGCSQPAPEIRYQIETDQPCQTMAYFSASDAWSMQFIGLWPQEKQDTVVRLIYFLIRRIIVNRLKLVTVKIL